MNTEYDLAVIGGGLAGCSAAITAAMAGASVVVFEAKAYPHHKVCGEFLSPECGGVFETLGLRESLQAHHPPRITHSRITTPSGQMWETRMPGTAMGLSRYRLDEAMAARARALGVRLHEKTPVVGVGGSLDDGFTLHHRGGSVRARTVVSAHGKRAALDRTLKRRFLNTPQPFIGLKAHFRGTPVPHRVDLHTFAGGYCGISEIEDGRVNVCLLVQEPIFKRAGGLEPFVAWMQAQNPALREWMRGAERVTDWLAIAQVPFVDKAPVVDDLLMAGDSAGLIAPLAGDGMAMALRGGELAATTLLAFLDGESDADAVRAGYAAAWRREFGGRLRVGRVLQASMFRPALLGAALHIVSRVPPLGDFFVASTRDVKLANQRGDFA